MWWPFKKKAAPVISGDVNQVAQQISQLVGANSAGVDVSYTSAMRHADVYTCVKIKAETMGQIPMKLYVGSDNKKKEVRDGKYNKLFTKKPNDYMNWITFNEFYVATMETRGNFYAYINRNVFGNVSEIIPFKHQNNVSVGMDSNGDIYYTYTTNDNRSRSTYLDKFENKDILHLKGVTDNGYLGMSPIYQTYGALGTAIASEQHANSMLRNGGNLNGILTTKGNFEDDGTGIEALNRMKAEWNESHGGGANSGKTAILEGGVEFKPIQMSAVDAQLIDQMKLSREQVASIFRVPYHMLSTSGMKYNNLSESNTAFMRDSMMPLINKMRVALCEILPANHFVEFDIRAYMSGDEAGLTEVLVKQKAAGLITTNDARSRLGYDPVDGGDVFVVRTNNEIMGAYTDLPPVDEQLGGGNNNPEPEPEVVDEEPSVQEEE